MRTYKVSLYNTFTRKRATRTIEAKTMLEAWQFANASCHGTHWVCKGITL